MFDIGFSEIVVCAVVALIVIGPERLPETVRTIGLWIGRLKRSMRDTRAEIERQIGVDDIRRQLHNEEIMRSLESARHDINSVIEHGQQTIHSTQQEIKRVYTSEPDLPFHSHMDEESAEKAELAKTPVLSINTPQNDKLPELNQQKDVDIKQPIVNPETAATTKSTS